ncbi:MAG: hypothetical protein VX976_00680 [Pseudomonadota bacterium]|nr:hypothetical protein [Pseudomonadota bacterium]
MYPHRTIGIVEIKRFIIRKEFLSISGLSKNLKDLMKPTATL